ncbi:MAG TPA: hypothetical protein PLY93_09970 [Turneriella sp.]|nr:hypothetical protein [Turneriella sp.]
MKRIYLYMVVLFMLPMAIHAHYIWIEYDKGREAKVYFGGVEDNEREVLPGKLDKIIGLKAHTIDAQGMLKESVVKKTSHYLGVEAQPNTTSIYVETLVMPVADLSKFGLGVVKPNYYARFGMHRTSSPQKAEMNLDILPVANAKDTMQILFRGKGLEKAKVSLYAPNTWMKEYRTDKDGKIQLSLPWTGEYVLEVIYTEKVSGKFDGKAYEAIRHRATYTFVVE